MLCVRISLNVQLYNTWKRHSFNEFIISQAGTFYNCYLLYHRFFEKVFEPFEGSSPLKVVYDYEERIEMLVDYQYKFVTSEPPIESMSQGKQIFDCDERLEM